jgi:hypothetical protein
MGNQNAIDGQGANQASGRNEKQIPQNQAEFLKMLYPANGFGGYDIFTGDVHLNISIWILLHAVT